MKIQIYGSGHLARLGAEALLDHGFDVVGFVPSRKPTIYSGDPPVPEGEYPHDVLLSLQYDRKIKDIGKAFNVHTGLLPEWGGCDILYHTVKRYPYEQGFTFHKITEEFDYGPVVARQSYPVFRGETICNLYHRVERLFPLFVVQCMRTIESIPFDRIDECLQLYPQMYQRGKITVGDEDMYRETLEALREEFGK